MGLRELHNMTPIDTDIEKAIVSIRESLKINTKLTEKEKHIVNTTYKAITGKNPAIGCNGCNDTIKIVNNWLKGFYDKKETINEEPTYKELLNKAKDLGFIKEGKGRVKMTVLKDFINGN